MPNSKSRCSTCKYLSEFLKRVKPSNNTLSVYQTDYKAKKKNIIKYPFLRNGKSG